jgi:hypothetical protein
MHKNRYRIFHESDLVTWHEQNGKQSTPTPGVVVRHDDEHVIIKARIQNTVREVHVDPDQLAIR